VHVCDTAFAGSDTLATARALRAALAHEARFDLVLCGRNSVDADTGQVGPELAELLDVAFVTNARHLTIDPANGAVHARSETDDGFAQLRTAMPAVVSCAERLIDPCKIDPERRALVADERLARLEADALGPGPWGAAGSPTSVGRVRVLEHTRARRCAPDLPVAEQVGQAVEFLRDRGAFAAPADTELPAVPGPLGLHGPAVVVAVEPDRARLTAELLSAAAEIAAQIEGHVVAFGAGGADVEELGARGADLVVIHDARVEERVAHALRDWSIEHDPWAVLAPSTTWGREVAGRAAAQLGAGLTGDAVELEVAADGRLVAWKPAFGGALVAAIRCASPVQMVTVRAGTLAALAPRAFRPESTAVHHYDQSRVEVLARARDDDLDVLADADTILAVGQGVDPARYDELEPLRRALHAEIGATRKVTDMGWLPRARQIGITGRSVSPRLLVSVGAGGKFNHSVGFRNAAHVLAINPEPSAPIFGFADVGIVAKWDEALPLLLDAIDAIDDLS
jgi:electron transfer flavoprotein alpha subunit